MAKKENVHLDDDDDLDFKWDDLDIDSDFSDGNENKKDRTPVEALKAGAKEAISEQFSLDGIESTLDSAMPGKFTAAKDDLKNYVQSGKQLFDESFGEVSRSVAQSRERVRKAAAVYERAGMPKLLVELMKKIGGRAEDREEEIRRSEEQENQAEITGALDDLANAQLEMQKNAQARDMIREEMEGKRFESQQELLFGIHSNLQRANDYREQIATRYYNNQIKISFQQLHTQRSLLRSVLQSAEHQKSALDSIVKNTALPDIVKQRRSELMKDIFQRRLGNYISGKFGNYVSGFKDNLLNNINSTVKGAVSGFTSGLDTLSGAVEMHADGMETMMDMEEMLGGKQAHQNGQRLGKFLSSGAMKYFSKSALGQMGKSDRAIATSEKFSRFMANLPAYANRWKNEVGKRDKNNEANFLEVALAGFIPGYSEGGVTHNINSEGKLKEQAEFDNKTRSSIVDVIPALLSKIHQSTEAIRMGVASHVKTDDDNLLEWDTTTNTLASRRSIDDKVLKRIRTAANNNQQIKIAHGIINLIDPPGPLGKTSIPMKIREKLSEAIIQHSAKGMGFQIKDFLNPDSPLYSGMKADDVEKIITLATKNLTYGGPDGLSRTEAERRMTTINSSANNIAGLRNYTHDTISHLSSISGTDESRMMRINAGRRNADGSFTTDDKHVSSDKVRRALMRKMGATSLLNQKLYVDRNDGVDTSLNAFINLPGYEPDPTGQTTGTIPNPSTTYLRGKNGKPKSRITYEEWVEFTQTFEGSAKEKYANFKDTVTDFFKNKQFSIPKIDINEGEFDDNPSVFKRLGKFLSGATSGARKVFDPVTTFIGGNLEKGRDAVGQVKGVISATIDNALTDIEWDMPKNEFGGYDWEKIQKAVSNNTNRQSYLIVLNKLKQLLQAGVKPEDIDIHIDAWLRDRTGRNDKGITLAQITEVKDTLVNKTIEGYEKIKNHDAIQALLDGDTEALMKELEKGEKLVKRKFRKGRRAAKQVIGKGKKQAEKLISQDNALLVQNYLHERAGIDIPLTDIKKRTGEEITDLIQAVSTKDYTQSPLLMELVTKADELGDKIKESELGQLAVHVKEEGEKRVKQVEEEIRQIKEKTQDVYVKGELEPRLLGRKLAEGQYVLLHGNKTVYDINDITGPVIDRETGDRLITTDDFNKGLVTVKGEEIKTSPRSNNALSKMSRMDSWTMTKAVVKFMMKPIKTMDTTDAYLPSEDGSEPRLVISKYKMLVNWYRDKDGNPIKRIQDITGDVFDKFNNKVLDAEDIPKLVDTRGRPLSKSYFIRRARLAKDMLSPLVKLHTKPIAWLTKKLITNPIKNRLGDAGENLKDKAGGLLSLLGLGKRKGLAEDELSSQDANTRAREEAIAKRNAEAEAKRKKGNEGGLFSPLINFLKGSFKKLLLIGGPLFMLFKDGISAGLDKMWGIGKWMIDNFGGHVWDAIKWIGTPILAWMGMKAAGKWAAGKAWNMAKDAFGGDADIDIDIDRRGKRKGRTPKPKGKGGLFRTVADGVKNTFTSGKDAIKNKAAKNTIQKTAMSQQKYTLAQQTAKKAAAHGMSAAGQRTVAKQAAKQAGKTLATQAAKQVGKKALLMGAGGLVAGTIAAPLIAIAAGLWTAYEIGSWAFEYFKSNPNAVDKFRIAAYGVNPDNDYRASNVLKLEKYLTEVSSIKEDGTLHVPDINWSEKGKAGDIMMGFLGGDKGRQIYQSLSDDEKAKFAYDFENWYTNRFLPVYQQHVISLNQIDSKLKLHEAFDRVGSNTIKFGLVPSWLRRAYFDKPENNPYHVMADPFLYSEDDEDGKDVLASVEMVKMHFDDAISRYKNDEIDLRKSESRKEKWAQANGVVKKHSGLFDFEKTTTKFDATKPTQTTTSSVSMITSQEAAKRIAYNKDGSFSETEIIGNNIYLLSDTTKVDTKGQTFIDDGIAIRMRLYGLTHLVDSKVNTLLSLEKMVLPYLKIEGNWFASFTKFDMTTLLKSVSIQLGWSNDQFDLASLQNWFIHRFGAVFLAYASLVNQHTSSKDILNAEKNMKPEVKYDIYTQLSLLKGKFNGNYIPIWDLPYMPVKGLEVNKNSDSILVNLKNIENDKQLVLLTERETVSKPIMDKTTNWSTATPTALYSKNEGSLNSGTSGSTYNGPQLGNLGSIANIAIDASTTAAAVGTGDKPITYSAKGATADKVAVAKTMFEEMDKLGWSETEKNHFLAQVTHETHALKWLKEQDSASYFAKKKYGEKWKGRGIIQLTWKDNYEKFAKWANRPDVMENPDLVATDPVLAVKSGIFWWENRKRESAKFRKAVTDPNAVVTVSKFVNGGTNGLNDRINQYKQYAAGKGVLREMVGNPASQSASESPKPTSTVASGIANMALDATKQANNLGNTSHAAIYDKMGVELNKTEQSAPSYAGTGGFEQQGERKNHTSTPGQVSTSYATEGVGKTNVLGGGKASDALAKATPELVELGKKTLPPLSKNVILDGMKPNFMKLLYASAGKYAQQGGRLAGITSAFRTEAEQERLRKLNPKNAAKGRSRHQDGIAIDLNNNGVKDTKSGPVDKFFASGIPQEFGFKRNLLYSKSGDVWEPWHLENQFVGKNSGSEPEVSPTNEVSGNPLSVLEQSANNGTYNDQTISSNTGYQETSGGNTSVLGGGSYRPSVGSIPQVSENTYSGIHARGGYTSSNPDNPLGEAWGQVFNSEGNIGKTENLQYKGMQSHFDKQGAQLEVQQNALIEQQKQLSDNMTNVLKEQLAVQKESKDLLGKLVEFITEGKKIAGTNVSDPKSGKPSGWYEIPQVPPGTSRHQIGQQARPAVNMGVGG